ncbi:MAG: MBL fold metallo-hydrolase [Actinomycetota bacterium]|nr:MBL fold metallo-hydrolase [Actinomycetota bacterium]
MGDQPGLERVAEGVWLVRGGTPRRMNVYLIEDGGRVTVFDAGIRTMAGQILSAAARLGGIERVVLGHSHVDHRGAAPFLGAPVLCHRDERADAESDGGMHYFEIAKLELPARLVYPSLLRHWDGGPVPIADTFEEGDRIAGFEVVHLPGHAPGQVALWRREDRLALTSDVFYTVDPRSGLRCSPQLPHDAFNLSRPGARRSLLKLAALEPAAAWPGHAHPLRSDVRAMLEAVAAAG